jgi:hypothetical protein
VGLRYVRRFRRVSTAFGWHFGYVNIRALNREDSVLTFLQRRSFDRFTDFDVVAAESDVGPGFSPAAEAGLKASPTPDLPTIDLLMDYNRPPPPVAEPARSPTPFRPHDEARAGRRGAVVLLFVIILAALAAAGYFITRPSTQQTSEAQDAKPAVAETVVDLPAAPPSPPAPPPTPSRPASGAAARSNAGAVRGNLLIRTSPPGADLYVNGRGRGTTPASLRDLPLGSYTIRIARDGYAAIESQVQLTSRNSTASMNIALQPTPAQRADAPPSPATTGVGGIAVQSRPAGARVFVDDRLMGSTPLSIPGFPPGPATVRIEMDGYQPWSTRVRVNAGEQLRVNASLDRK